MLHLASISVTRFKNYEFNNFQFKERVTGICGLNGIGKTNLLDAIYYLCFTKSYFSKSDAYTVKFGTDGFRLEGLFQNNAEKQKVVCIHRGPGKKELTLNDVLYEKFSAHIGKFPCVFIAPDDVDLISNGSEDRRKFIDTVLSQMDPSYLQALIIYNKVLQQRNSYLKKFTEQGRIDNTLLEVINQQLVAPGNTIFQKRKLFSEQLVPLVKQFYQQIAENDEVIDLAYESQLSEESFNSLLKKSIDKDSILQRTTTGIHKDDLGILLNGQVFKNIASQGQRKSLLFALKLAEFELLKENKGFAPLLLLDDVFEKLDDLRMQNLLKWVCVHNDGQIFITDTHQDRLEKALQVLEVPFQLISL